MKNLGVVLTVGITALILIVIGFLNFFPLSAAENASTEESVQAPEAETAAVPDTAAVQAAFAARETLLQAQIAELDTEYADRQGAYDLQLEEKSALFVAAEQQLAQLEDQETVLQERIDQLYTAQSERTATYESQRQQANYQYYVNIQQLQTQLDEANAKLSEALARLGN